ncbi:MAG: hypothetical protein CVV27_13200 [Candidatus Melainabacteria bacterium HGW-Melainabacteria-1]|nr:MAG: hypothetical protein CVV27_13200 [Candidatus Melainabacteria bacterium HGW-Melainabacteria-1]
MQDAQRQIQRTRQPSMQARYRIQQGKILIYHLFDIGDEIDLDKLRHQWAGRSTNIRLVSRRSSPYYMQFDKEPLLLPLGEHPLLVTPDRSLQAEARAKAFDYGVISICWEVPTPDEWTELLENAYLYIDSDQIAAQSRKLLDEMMPAFQGAVTGAHDKPLMEDYTIFYIQRFEVHLSAEQLLDQAGADIVSIVRGETKPLSRKEQEHVLEKRISYFDDDLVVMAWNSSFIYDPEGSSEHVDILEFANSELLELRAYDQLLDKQLAQIYDELEGLPEAGPWSWLSMMRVPVFTNPYEHTTQKLLTLLIDVAELTDRIENSLKIIGDLYLARIYQQISVLLRLQQWQGRVDGKLASARQIYETLTSEMAERRSTYLGLIVILLIAMGIATFFLPGGGH